MTIAPPVLGKGRGGSGAPPGSCRTLLIMPLGDGDGPAAAGGGREAAAASRRLFSQTNARGFFEFCKAKRISVLKRITSDFFASPLEFFCFGGELQVDRAEASPSVPRVI